MSLTTRIAGALRPSDSLGDAEAALAALKAKLAADKKAAEAEAKRQADIEKAIEKAMPAMLEEFRQDWAEVERVAHERFLREATRRHLADTLGATSIEEIAHGGKSSRGTLSLKRECLEWAVRNHPLRKAIDARQRTPDAYLSAAQVEADAILHPPVDRQAEARALEERKAAAKKAAKEQRRREIDARLEPLYQQGTLERPQ